MATVKGDVHDIGKNIVGVVLQCNNYQVIDLGVMVPAQKILETAKREKADIIGLSGLITPSLDEMCHVAAEMEREGFDGAAADRRRHHQPRAHGGEDQSQLPRAARPSTSRTPAAPSAWCRRLMSETERKGRTWTPCARSTSRSAKPTCKGESKKTRLHACRRRATTASPSTGPATKPPKPKFLGTRAFKAYKLAELVPYIDWTPFFQTWELQGKYPRILEDNVVGAEAKKLFADAQAMLKRIVAEKWLTANAVVGFWPANAVGDDIELLRRRRARDASSPPCTRCASRWRARTGRDRANTALADFIAPRGDRARRLRRRLRGHVRHRRGRGAGQVTSTRPTTTAASC